MLSVSTAKKHEDHLLEFGENNRAAGQGLGDGSELEVKAQEG